MAVHAPSPGNAWSRPWTWWLPGAGENWNASAFPTATGDSLTLTIELTLPTTDQQFTIPAVVRWTNTRDSANQIGEGFGVQFVGVDVDVLLELNDYFASLTSV